MSTPEDQLPPVEPAAAPIPASTTVAARQASWDSAAEQFARGMLRERRSERRWRNFFRLSWLLLV